MLSSKEIDYTYVWDIFTRPNPKLFTKGINIILLEIISNDTQDVRVICPTNVYSDYRYDNNMDFCIILKYGNYYEPVYGFKDSKDTSYMKATFRRHDTQLKQFFDSLDKVYNICKARPSIQATRPEHASFYGKKLQEANYRIIYQILDLHANVVGLTINENNSLVYIPCFPSALLKNIPIRNSSEIEYKSYKETKEYLRRVHERSNHKIHVLPMKKIVELIDKKKMVVGIVTEMNGIVPIHPFIEDVDDELVETKNRSIVIHEQHNKLPSKINIQKTSKQLDIKYHEDTMFQQFRSFIRFHLQDIRNRSVRYNIEKNAKHHTLQYTEKLNIVRDLLEKFIEDKVKFTNDKLDCQFTPVTKLEKKPKINSCIKKAEAIFPKTNKLNGISNRQIYITKIADELIRHQEGIYYYFIPYHMFPKTNETKLHVNPDEMIMTHQELLESKEVPEKSIYGKYYKDNTSFMYSEPDTSELYDFEMKYRPRVADVLTNGNDQAVYNQKDPVKKSKNETEISDKHNNGNHNNGDPKISPIYDNSNNTKSTKSTKSTNVSDSNKSGSKSHEKRSSSSNEIKTKKKQKRKRCPKGTRRNKEGNCVPVAS